jgi:hypothetical protein
MIDDAQVLAILRDAQLRSELTRLLSQPGWNIRVVKNLDQLSRFFIVRQSG